MKPTQEAFLQQPNTKKMAERLRRNYGADYEEGSQQTLSQTFVNVKRDGTRTC
jgi:hypothetical protein